MSITTAASAAATTSAATSVTATAAAGGEPVSGVVTTITGVPIDFATGGLIATILLLTMLVIKELISTRSGKSLSEMVRTIGVGIVSLVPLFGVIVSLRVLSAI